MPLLLASHDEIRQNRDHRPVHGHRDRHLVQRDAVKQDFHILDGIDGHASLADVPFYAGVVAVIATVCRQIESNGNALLASRQSTAVKGVGFFCGRKPRILPDRPRTTCVHRGFYATGKRGLPGHAAHMVKPLNVVSGIKRLYVDPFKRVPRQVVNAPAAQFGLSQIAPVFFVGCHGFVLLSCRPLAGFCLLLYGRYPLSGWPDHRPRQQARTDRLHMFRASSPIVLR